jgi:hypothetical protein
VYEYIGDRLVGLCRRLYAVRPRLSGDVMRARGLGDFTCGASCGDMSIGVTARSCLPIDLLIPVREPSETFFTPAKGPSVQHGTGVDVTVCSKWGRGYFTARDRGPMLLEGWLQERECHIV